jgi:hypothetical protein
MSSFLLYVSSGGIYTPEELKDKSKSKLIFISCGSVKILTVNLRRFTKTVAIMLFRIFLKYGMNFATGGKSRTHRFFQDK